MNPPQSGLAKQRDFTITQEVLRAYGDAVKDTMRRVLRAIVAARQDDVVIDISGLDEFDIGDFSNELEDARTYWRWESNRDAERGVQETRIQVSVRCQTGIEGPDCGARSTQR